MPPSQTAPSPGAESRPVLSEAVKHFIVQRMRRYDSAARIAALVEQNFHIQVDREQMLACWHERNTRPTQAEPTPAEPTPAEPTQTKPTQAELSQDKESVQIPADQAGEPLFTLMPCAETPDAVHPDAMTAPPTRTGPGQRNESLQIPAAATDTNTVDTPSTRTGPGQKSESPQIPAATDTDTVEAPSTRTGPGQENESPQIADEIVIPSDDVREFIIARMARRESPWLIVAAVERTFGIQLDRDEIVACFRDRDVHPTRTGPGQENESRPKLTDEHKEFMVKRLACYETPSRIAAAMRMTFGIDIDRRRVFDYDPAGSRPPAQRWIDLYTATRAKFLRDVSEIGIAQKVIRLRTLERLAEMAEENNRDDRVARYLQQAARECGGFYEKHRAPHSSHAEDRRH